MLLRIALCPVCPQMPDGFRQMAATREEQTDRSHEMLVAISSDTALCLVYTQTAQCMYCYVLLSVINPLFYCCYDCCYHFSYCIIITITVIIVG